MRNQESTLNMWACYDHLFSGKVVLQTDKIWFSQQLFDVYIIFLITWIRDQKLTEVKDLLKVTQMEEAVGSVPDSHLSLKPGRSPIHHPGQDQGWCPVLEDLGRAEAKVKSWSGDGKPRQMKTEIWEEKSQWCDQGQVRLARSIHSHLSPEEKQLVV